MGGMGRVRSDARSAGPGGPEMRAGPHPPEVEDAAPAAAESGAPRVGMISGRTAVRA